MPNLETPRELAEDIANMLGVYGNHDEKNNLDCKCRHCFVDGMRNRIIESVENQQGLNELWNLRKGY